jgi:SHS2 domain-containing protein
MVPKRYEELDHTADVQLRIFGAGERELFANAAFALFDKMVDLSRVESRRTVEIEASGADIEETLVNFLAELLYRYNAGRFICRECRITELAPTRVRSVCTGEDFDPARHEARAEIKAVTFHDVKITRAADALEVTLTCDV